MSGPAPPLGCVLHTTHAPRPLTIEQHHVVPRAWQTIYTPAAPPFPGRYQGQRLWDAREAAVCPTGHRNVHAVIVAVMRDLAKLPPATPLDETAIAAARMAAGKALRPTVATLNMASQAPLRFIAAGGELRALIAVGQWGEA